MYADNIDNKIAIVTGASGLIGSAIAMELLKNNIYVIGTYNKNINKLHKWKNSIENNCLLDRFMEIPCDLNDENSIIEMSTYVSGKFKNIDILVCNAAMKHRALLMLTKSKSVTELLDTNIRGTILCVKHLTKSMLIQKSGQIVIVGSRAGNAGMPGQSVYSATKSALLGFVKSVAFEFGVYGININLLSPGAVYDLEEPHYNKEEQKSVVEKIGLRRLGTAEEIAKVASFLCSSAASYISGSEVIVDGASRF